MNPITNPLILFLQELFLRFKTKSPKFFKIWQLISGAATIICGLPEALEYFHITPPDVMLSLMNKTISRIASGLFIMSMLSTQSKTVGVTKEGAALKQTNPDLLPFTSQIENKKAADKPVIGIEVVNKVDEQVQPEGEKKDN